MTEDSPEKRIKAGGFGRAVEAGLSGEAMSAGGVLAAIGGWRGVVESLLPATLYLVGYAITRDARTSVIAPVAVVAIAALWRLVKREPLTAILSGALGVGVCVAAVLWTGEGTSYFVPGFFISGSWFIALAISLVVGWPLIGVFLGVFRGSLTYWRKIVPLRRAAQLTTVVWVMLFGARLAVQLPLYFAGSTEALGIARLLMGVPLFALGVVFTWFVLSRVIALVDDENRAENGSQQSELDSQSSDE